MLRFLLKRNKWWDIVCEFIEHGYVEYVGFTNCSGIPQLSADAWYELVFTVDDGINGVSRTQLAFKTNAPPEIGKFDASCFILK